MRILCKNDKYALVDPVDYELVRRLSWRAYFDGWNWYARRDVKIHGKFRSLMMHRYILGITDPRVLVDHKDGNGLNNRRANLRIATNGQNCAHSKKQNRKTKSRFKGVSVCRDSGWKSYIRFKTKYIHLGVFASERDAAKAYDSAAVKYFGQFALTNFKQRRKQ